MAREELMIRITSGFVIAMLGLAACSSDDLDSDAEAQRAYLGLDKSIGKSMTLGFAGFNAATNANIPDQNGVGLTAGSLLISGQVDAGASNNKEMRLRIGMIDYNDGVFTVDGDDTEIDITYNTAADTDRTLQPELDLSLHNFPNGTLDGTLLGDYTMTGDIEGTATLNLVITGTIMDDGTGATVRAPGTTHITGTAVSGDGTYDVDVTL
jgi:hypothetical protein